MDGYRDWLIVPVGAGSGFFIASMGVPVPESGTYALVAMGLAMLAAVRRFHPRGAGQEPVGLGWSIAKRRESEDRFR